MEKYIYPIVILIVLTVPSLSSAQTISALQKIIEAMMINKNVDSIMTTDVIKSGSIYLQGLPKFKEKEITQPYQGIVKGGDTGHARFSLISSDLKKHIKTILVEAFYSCLDDHECESWFKKQLNGNIYIQPLTHGQCRLFHYPADSPVYHFDRFYKLSIKNKKKYIIYAYVSATNWATSTMPNGSFKIHFYYHHPEDKIKKFKCY